MNRERNWSTYSFLKNQWPKCSTVGTFISVLTLINHDHRGEMGQCHSSPNCLKSKNV